KYGLIEPDFVIPQNYNCSFYDSAAIPVAEIRAQIISRNLVEFHTIGVLGSQEYWGRLRAAGSGLGLVLCHVNGNVGFPPSFIKLVNSLLASDTPFHPASET